MSGVVAVAAVLGGVAVPAVAMAQPASSGPSAGVAAVRGAEVGRMAEAFRKAGIAWPADLSRLAGVARPAGSGVILGRGEPVVSCVLTTDCLGVESTSVIDGSWSSGGFPGSGGVSSVAGVRSDAAKAAPTLRAVRWNGSSWKGVGVAVPRGIKSADVNGVSCKGAKACLVVGDYYTSFSDNAVGHPLALTYNGTRLKPTSAVPVPKGATYAGLTAVSCATTRYCVAIGVAEGTTRAFGRDGELNLIETWNGAKWTLRTVAQASGSSDIMLGPVSCPTIAFCALAGVTTSATGTGNSATVSMKMYLASWNGKKLTAMKPPAVSGAADRLPTAVSCSAPGSCAVTGADLGTGSSSSENPTPFAEIWNGKAWQLATSPWPAGDVASVPMSVSCYAARACEAVGMAVGVTSANDESSDAVAASYHGTTGALQAVPAPAKGNSTVFNDVSCMPWGTCVAVGWTGKNTASMSSVMTGVWNGKTWKLEPGF
jgi:hypothetical protein